MPETYEEMVRRVTVHPRPMKDTPAGTQPVSLTELVLRDFHLRLTELEEAPRA